MANVTSLKRAGYEVDFLRLEIAKLAERDAVQAAVAAEYLRDTEETIAFVKAGKTDRWNGLQMVNTAIRCTRSALSR